MSLLRRQVPEPDRVRLLRSFDPEAPSDAEVPDPFYGPPEGFEEVLWLIESATPALVEWLRNQA